MITIESLLPTLNELFIEKLPLYIEEINKEKNDGINISPFENINLFDNCQKFPCFNFELQETEYSEKDRIIENTVFEFTMEIKTKSSNYLKTIEVSRYAQAIDKMINENEHDLQQFKILKIYVMKLLFKVVL